MKNNFTRACILTGMEETNIRVFCDMFLLLIEFNFLNENCMTGIPLEVMEVYSM